MGCFKNEIKKHVHKILGNKYTIIYIGIIWPPCPPKGGLVLKHEPMILKNEKSLSLGELDG